MTLKKKLSSTEWSIFFIVSGMVIILNFISLVKTKTINKKLKETSLIVKKEKQ